MHKQIHEIRFWGNYPDFGTVKAIISRTDLCVFVCVWGDKSKSHVGVCRPRVLNLRPTLLDATVTYRQLLIPLNGTLAHGT